MRRLQQFAICALLLFPAAAFAGEIIDGVVATVNRQAVLQSDWDDATRFEAFMQQEPLTAVTEKERVTALQRLIDLSLHTGDYFSHLDHPGSDCAMRARTRVRLLGIDRDAADALSAVRPDLAILLKQNKRISSETRLV